MTKSKSLLVRQGMFVLVVLVLVGFVDAQTNSRDKTAIEKIKNLSASQLDRELPSIRFPMWLVETVEKGQEIKWEVNDCGEQDGSGRRTDFPICVDATVKTQDNITVSVCIVVGTYKRGVFGRPELWGIWINADKKQPQVLMDLKQIPKHILALREENNN